MKILPITSHTLSYQFTIFEENVNFLCILSTTKNEQKPFPTHFSVALTKTHKHFILGTIKLISPSILKCFQRCLNIVDIDDTNNGRWRLR